jgi:hypothetical protein
LPFFNWRFGARAVFLRNNDGRVEAMEAGMADFAGGAAARGLARLGQWSIVRLLIFAVVLIAVYLGLQIGASMLTPRQPGLAHDAARSAAAAVLVAVMCGVYVLLVRGIERREASELRLGGAAGNFVGGVILGAGLFTAVYATLYLLGVVRIDRVAWDPKVAITLAAAVGAAVAEELAIRGGVFRVAEDAAGTLVALLFSAALFGLLHAANPGATVVSAVSIALEAGVLLGLAYALTRSLWLPIGLHLGWNFTEGGVFGAAVSGGKAHSLIHATASGPDLITGGAFGPEGSVVAVGFSLLLSAILAVAVVRRGHWKPLAWRLRLPLPDNPAT